MTIATFVPDLITGIRRYFSNQINRVEFIVENPCNAPWTVYLETFFPAAGQALLILLIPSPEEILENYLQPKPGRGPHRRGSRDDPRRRRHPGGFLRRAWRRGIPDVDDLISDRIPGRSWFESRTPRGIEKLFWRTIDLTDRVFWYWLVADVVDTFTYTWSSGIMESKFCTASFNAYADGEGGTDALTDEPLWDHETELDPRTENNLDIRGSGSVHAPNGKTFSGRIVATAEGILQNIFANRFGCSEHWLEFQVKHPDGTTTIVEGPHESGCTGDPIQIAHEAEVDVMDSVQVVTRLAYISGDAANKIATPTVSITCFGNV